MLKVSTFCSYMKHVVKNIYAFKNMIKKLEKKRVKYNDVTDDR